METKQKEFVVQELRDIVVLAAMVRCAENTETAVNFLIEIQDKSCDLIDYIEKEASA